MRPPTHQFITTAWLLPCFSRPFSTTASTSCGAAHFFTTCRCSACTPTLPTLPTFSTFSTRILFLLDHHVPSISHGQLPFVEQSFFVLPPTRRALAGPPGSRDSHAGRHFTHQWQREMTRSTNIRWTKDHSIKRTTVLQYFQQLPHISFVGAIEDQNFVVLGARPCVAPPAGGGGLVARNIDEPLQATFNGFSSMGSIQTKS